jgi:hypothetical protein
MINKQNFDNQLGNLKLDGMQITGTPPPGTIGSGTIATYHPDGTVTYTAETASSDSGSGGGYTATGSKNMIITDGSLNNVEQNLKVRKEVLEGCQYKVKQMFNGNTTNLDVWSTQIRMVYKIVLFNWCKGVFMDGADASTPPVRYTSGHYDLEVIDGRWDFPYVADHKLPSSSEFSFLNKAQDKVPIIEECIAVSGESPLSYRNPAIVTIENGKHPEYNTVTFASGETPNRFYYFLRNAKNSDIYKQPQYASIDVNAAYKEETNYSQFATYQMRTVCRDWAALQIKVITGEIAGLSYIGGNLIDNGQTASDKSMSLMTAADVQIQNERKARLDQLNNLMNTLNAQVNAYLDNVKSQSFMNSINFTSGR